MKSIYTKEAKQLAVRLRSARQAAGLSQAEAAKTLKRSQSYISKIESGQIKVDIAQLKTLARIYDVSMHGLIS